MVIRNTGCPSPIDYCSLTNEFNFKKTIKKKTFRNETLKEYEALLKENGGYLFKFLKYIYSDANVLRRMLF